jgi:hypothetical protein
VKNQLSAEIEANALKDVLPMQVEIPEDHLLELLPEESLLLVMERRDR